MLDPRPGANSNAVGAHRHIARVNPAVLPCKCAQSPPATVLLLQQPMSMHFGTNSLVSSPSHGASRVCAIDRSALFVVPCLLSPTCTAHLTRRDTRTSERGCCIAEDDTRNTRPVVVGVHWRCSALKLGATMTLPDSNALTRAIAGAHAKPINERGAARRLSTVSRVPWDTAGALGSG